MHKKKKKKFYNQKSKKKMGKTKVTEYKKIYL